MLTRDLLRYRVNRGNVQPRFVAVEDEELLGYAASLLAVLTQGCGKTRGDLESLLAQWDPPHGDLLLARGLQKLLMDRCDFAEADPLLPQRRAEAYSHATRLLREQAEPVTRQEFCARLVATYGPTEHLYGDLPEARPLQAFKAPSAKQLLQIYNLAQVQGLVLASSNLTIETNTHETLPVRRVLRWLKFCRLVAEVHRTDKGHWTMQVTGPAHLLEHAKKYGLQLATFVSVVPVLPTFSLQATIMLRTDNPWQLRIDESHQLVSPQERKLGHIPPELKHIKETFRDDAWRIDASSTPRVAGGTGMMLPDFICKHRDGTMVHVELFHRWHQHALRLRIEQLKVKPDSMVLLGVDKSLAARSDVAPSLESLKDCQAFVFSQFPTPNKLRQSLNKLVPEKKS